MSCSMRSALGSSSGSAVRRSSAADRGSDVPAGCRARAVGPASPARLPAPVRALPGYPRDASSSATVRPCRSVVPAHCPSVPSSGHRDDRPQRYGRCALAPAHRGRASSASRARRCTMSPAATGRCTPASVAMTRRPSLSSATASPTSSSPPGSSARTVRPSVAHPAAYASSSRCRADRRRRRTSARTSPPGSAAPHAAAGRGRCPARPRGRAIRLRERAVRRAQRDVEPQPEDDAASPSAGSVRSARMPPVLRSSPSTSTRTSLGHFSFVSTPAAARARSPRRHPRAAAASPSAASGTSRRAAAPRRRPRAGRRAPAAVQPAASGGLLLRDEYGALLGAAVARARREVGVGRARALHHLQRRPQAVRPDQRAAQRGRR